MPSWPGFKRNTGRREASSSIRYHEPEHGPGDLSSIVNRIDEPQPVHEIRDLPAVVVRELVIGIGIVRISLVQIPFAKVIADGFRDHAGPILSDKASVPRTMPACRSLASSSASNSGSD